MYEYHNRDISWLSFNYRVLEEAKDPSLPLYERLKFLAIYSNNLEEFYRVRVSYYRDLLRTLKPEDKKFRTVQPDKIVKKINSIVSKHQEEFENLFNNELIVLLEKNNIHLAPDCTHLTKKQLAFAEEYFNNGILPNLQPVILQNKRVRPFLKSGHLYIAIKLRNLHGIRYSYGLVKLPLELQPSRFIELPKDKGKTCIMFIEDLTMHFIGVIFPGYEIREWYIIKLTRDADIELDDFEGQDLIRTVSSLSQYRQLGEPNRFQYDRTMPKSMLNYLCKNLEITNDDLVAAGKHQNFRDFFGFPNPLAPELEYPKHIPLRVQELEKASNIFDVLQQRDYLLHFPYQSYNAFIQFLFQAADDPDVTEIKATQYRVATNSAVVDALIRAAINGKRVTVFVELKARFDEETNLQYSKEMQAAGITVIYSIAGIKVHSKVVLVCRKSNELVEKYAFLGTGNFNEKTAKLYADHGLFTYQKSMTDDVEKMFEFLNYPEGEIDLDQLLVSSQNMVATFKHLIKKEIEHAKKGKKAYILLKLNGLEDPSMINCLYKASSAGVKINILVRGICCLKTGETYSENIKTIRIVDSFLEHARVYYFYNAGKEIVYMGSADWMRRNLYKRIECAFPIHDKEMIREIMDIYNLQLSDNVKASEINGKMKNVRVENSNPPIRSQQAIMEYLRDKY